MTFFSVTANFPFFHKAQIDYSIISPRLDAFYANMGRYMEPVLGALLGPLASLMYAGVLYERGELERAETIAEEVVRTAERFPPEVQFSAMALYAETLRAQGKKSETGGIGEMIASTKARYLSANYRAFTTNANLARGDKDAAEDWLARSEAENPFKLYKIYRHFTTARALMVTGRLAEAEALTERLAAFSSAYRRPCDRIEALTLKSLCLWHMKRPADSVGAMTAAITEARALELVMPIIKEGGDALPVLQKILNRLKYGYDAESLDKSFVGKLFYGAQTMSQHKGLMVRANGRASVKLSARQSEILGYLEQNLSYREIGAKMGVKVTTVDDHIDKLYEKLSVTNARDAVMRAMELGIKASP